MERDENFVHISAYATDYSEKAYKLWYADGRFEFIPKSMAMLTEAPKGIDRDDPRSCYFRIARWLLPRLKGIEYYSVIW